MLGLCGRLWPLSASTSKDDGYIAHPLLTANMTAVVCGNGADEVTLDKEALAGLAAARVLRCAHAKTLDPNTKLDGINEWAGSDIAEALEGLYRSLGWDAVTGVPTSSTLQNLGLSKAAELLEAIPQE
jgi:hypothetical protein